MKRKPELQIQVFSGRKLLGWALVKHYDGYSVVHVFVKPKFRGREHGRALIEFAKAMALREDKKVHFRCECALDVRTRARVEAHQRWCYEAQAARKKSEEYVMIK